MFPRIERGTPQQSKVSYHNLNYFEKQKKTFMYKIAKLEQRSYNSKVLIDMQTYY